AQTRRRRQGAGREISVMGLEIGIGSGVGAEGGRPPSAPPAPGDGPKAPVVSARLARDAGPPAPAPPPPRRLRRHHPGPLGGIGPPAGVAGSNVSCESSVCNN